MIWFSLNNDAKNILNIIKLSKIAEIEMINCSNLKTNYIEEDLNPDNISFKIHKITYKNIDFCQLSDLAFQNISKINPRELHLPSIDSISDIIRILKNFTDNMTVKFDWGDFDTFPLRFSNTEVTIKDKDNLFSLYWKEIWFSFLDLEHIEIKFIDKSNIWI